MPPEMLTAEDKDGWHAVCARQRLPLINRLPRRTGRKGEATHHWEFMDAALARVSRYRDRARSVRHHRSHAHLGTRIIECIWS
jgi:hypothetical protein